MLKHELTINSPFGGALLVSISMAADPGPSGLFATTMNLYFEPGSKPIKEKPQKKIYLNEIQKNNSS